MARKQYIRRCNLIVADEGGDGLDLSPMRIRFSIKRSDAQTPNTAQIRVWNLNKETITKIKDEYTTITLQAGYESNYGVIFTGNIKAVRVGKENGVDGFVDIYAGDGEDDYNYAVVNTTLAAGSTQRDQVKAAAAPMKGVSEGYVTDLGQTKLPRGKVMYGMSRDYLRQSATATDTTWSVQDGKMQFVSLTGVLPTQAIVLNSKSGLIGTPEQTNDGIKARCLLNPLLKIGGKVQINEEDVAQAKPELGTGKNPPQKPPADIEKDGIYRLLMVEHSGDTRGGEWYSDLVCLGVDATQPESKGVKKNG